MAAPTTRRHLASWDDFDAAVADGYAALTNSVGIYPPACFHFGAHAGFYTFDDAGELASVTNLFHPCAILGLVPAWQVSIIETQGAERVWITLGADGLGVRTNAVPAAFAPDAWVRDGYGQPPAHLTGPPLTLWYAVRDRSRVCLGMSLIASNDWPMLQAALAVAATNRTVDPLTRPPTAPADTNRLAFAGIEPANSRLWLYTPLSEQVDLFSRTSLPPGAGPWTLLGTLDATAPFDAWEAAPTVAPSGFFHAARTVVDTDGDGLPDGREMLVFETDPSLTDSDDDGLEDRQELYLFASNPRDPDTDGDGMKDGLEAGNGTDPGNTDTDGDSADDSVEYAAGTSPTDAQSAPDPTEYVTLRISWAEFVNQTPLPEGWLDSDCGVQREIYIEGSFLHPGERDCEERMILDESGWPGVPAGSANLCLRTGQTVWIWTAVFPPLFVDVVQLSNGITFESYGQNAALWQPGFAEVWWPGQLNYYYVDRIFNIPKFDLDIDSANTNGVAVPLHVAAQEAIEDLGGDAAHPGKIIYMNDMDVDGDKIPDYLDGFDRIETADPDVEQKQQLTTGGAFVPVTLSCVLPEGLDLWWLPNNGLDPATTQLEFDYLAATPPSGIEPMSLAQAESNAVAAVTSNPLGTGIRLWTKNADQTRNPASVLDGGDYVPSGTRLPYALLMASARTNLVLYAEGVGVTPTWGEAKIEARLYPFPDQPDVFLADRVSFTVVRCVYKVCVYRPYVCLRDSSGTISSRQISRTDYSSPSNMVASYFEGQAHFDDHDKFHGLAAFMGHAFARVEVRIPNFTDGVNYWTGQTGMDDLGNLNRFYDAMKGGTSWWYRATDGHEDDPDKCETRYKTLYASPIDGAEATDPTNAIPKKMLAVREFRLHPDMCRALTAYKGYHPFGGYGLDTTLRTSSDSRVGCGSYVGLLTQYAGVTNVAPWVFDRQMPVVPLDDVWITWVGSGGAYAAYMCGAGGLLRAIFEDMGQEAMQTVNVAPGTAAWGSGGNTRSLRFCDPGWMMDWIDVQNALTTQWPQGGYKDRGVTVRYDVPPTSNLQEWRNRP